MAVSRRGVQLGDPGTGWHVILTDHPACEMLVCVTGMNEHADEGFRRSVLVVEDEPLLRSLLGGALVARGFRVATAGSPSQAREAFLGLDPDAVVMDIDLGPGPDGFELAESLLERETGLAVVFLTNLPDPRFAGRRSDQLPPGIAFLNKRAVSDVDLLVRTLDATLRGQVDASMRHDRDPRRPFAGLTEGQADVLRLVALGKTNAQIAQIRGTTDSAVERAVARVFDALGLEQGPNANHRVAAARRFFRWAGAPLPLADEAEPRE